MFELIFLGTSASAPSIHRGLPSQMVLANEYRFLIDCGEGTQRQILQSGMGFKRLNHIFLTHGHLDHILGLGGLLSTLTHWETDLEQIHIWAGKSTLERVKELIYGVVFPGQSKLPIFLHPLAPGIILENKKFTVSAFSVTHQGSGNFGFAFEEKTHRPFLAEKAEALGVPAGPIRGQLVAGKAVTLADGRVIQPEEVLGEDVKGVRYIHIGDCGSTTNLPEIVRDADCLVIEATYIDEEREMARQFGHMTAGEAARLARDCGVKTLILTHISRRNRKSDIRREAQSFFPATFIARDFDHFQMVRGKAVAKVLDPVYEESEE